MTLASVSGLGDCGSFMSERKDDFDGFGGSGRFGLSGRVNFIEASSQAGGGGGECRDTARLVRLSCGQLHHFS